MFANLKARVVSTVSTGLLVVAAPSAFAAPVAIDAAPITDQIGAGATAIGLIGVAVLSVIALAVCYKLIKKAF